MTPWVRSSPRSFCGGAPRVAAVAVVVHYTARFAVNSIATVPDSRTTTMTTTTRLAVAVAVSVAAERASLTRIRNQLS